MARCRLRSLSMASRRSDGVRRASLRGMLLYVARKCSAAPAPRLAMSRSRSSPTLRYSRVSVAVVTGASPDTVEPDEPAPDESDPDDLLLRFPRDERERDRLPAAVALSGSSPTSRA